MEWDLRGQVSSNSCLSTLKLKIYWECFILGAVHGVGEVAWRGVCGGGGGRIQTKPGTTFEVTFN